MKRLKNQKGIALLMAIFTFVLVSTLSMEMLTETHVEYASSSQGVNRLKSYYAAKTGLEIGLLRILIYKKALALAGDSLGSNAPLLDKIWNFPFVWPPLLPEQTSLADKQLVADSVKESLIDTAIATQISSESSKIDINDLASPSELLAKSVREQILRIFQNKVESDERFADLYRGYDFQTLVNNITDWVDEEDESLNGGSEKRLYQRLDLEPPNQPFKTKQELHMVADMTDELYQVLEPHITVYGAAGIQVNNATKEVLMSIDPNITEEIAKEVYDHIRNEDEGGPFADLKSFLQFLNNQGMTLDQEEFEKEGPPLFFDSELNFRIISTGTYSQIQREIVAIVYDFDRVKDRVASLIKTDDDQPSEGKTEEEIEARKKLEEKCAAREGDEKFECLCESESDEKKQECIDNEKKSSSNENEQNTKKEPPKGRPRIVYWFEE